LERAEPEIPPIDAIGQFKMLSSGAPAEFNEQAQLIVVSKSGGNQYHGEGLEFNRSKGTSAKQWNSGTLVRPAYERNEFGGNLSGPIPFRTSTMARIAPFSCSPMKDFA
jgi:hypothetical protein